MTGCYIIVPMTKNEIISRNKRTENILKRSFFLSGQPLTPPLPLLVDCPIKKICCGFPSGRRRKMHVHTFSQFSRPLFRKVYEQKKCFQIP